MMRSLPNQQQILDVTAQVVAGFIANNHPNVGQAEVVKTVNLVLSSSWEVYSSFFDSEGRILQNDNRYTPLGLGTTSLR